MTQPSAPLSPPRPAQTGPEPFDFLELLYLLTGQGRTGVLRVQRDHETFEAWLQGGRVRGLTLGARRGVAALAALLRDPRGQFYFQEGQSHPAPSLDATLDELALEALDALPPPDLKFSGPARVVSPERLAALRWTLREQDVLQRLGAQQPVSDLAREPDARHLLNKLSRMGLITARRSRVARLTVAVTRQVKDVVLVDDVILQRWKDAIVRHPQNVVIRTEDGQTHVLPVRQGAGLGTQLKVPPELLVRTGLRVGLVVLVKPV